VTRSSLLSRSHGRGASLFRSSFSPLAAADGGCLPPSLCCVLLVLARPAASAVQRTDHHPAVGVRDTRIRFQMMYHVNSVRRQTGRSIYNTHQSYTVGLLGVPGASAPSAILPFRRSFFQPSPLGVVAAASRWQRTYRKETTTSAGAGGVRACASDQISNIQLYKSSFKFATEFR
jgi:hypothetical protein